MSGLQEDVGLAGVEMPVMARVAHAGIRYYPVTGADNMATFQRFNPTVIVEDTSALLAACIPLDIWTPEVSDDLAFFVGRSIKRMVAILEPLSCFYNYGFLSVSAHFMLPYLTCNNGLSVITDACVLDL